MTAIKIKVNENESLPLSVAGMSRVENTTEFWLAMGVPDFLNDPFVADSFIGVKPGPGCASWIRRTETSVKHVASRSASTRE